MGHSDEKVALVGRPIWKLVERRQAKVDALDPLAVRLEEFLPVLQLGPLTKIEGGRKGHVITVDVVPEARRRKVATRLMERLHEELFLRNAASVFLEVSTKNTPAQRFYQGLGYEKKGVLRRYYRTCGDACLMTRRL